MPQITADTELQYLKGVGPGRAKALAEVGILRAGDLLLQLPYRYENRIEGAAASPADPTAAEVVVRSIDVRPTRRRGLKIVEMRADGAHGPVQAVWFNQVHLRRLLQPGRRVQLFGKRRPGTRQFQNPKWEFVEDREDPAAPDDASPHARRITPVYERVGPVTPRQFRTLIHGLLQNDRVVGSGYLPAEMVARLGLPSRPDALAGVHLPPEDASLPDLASRRSPGHRRLILEEFFCFAAGLEMRRRADRTGRARSRRFEPDDALRDEFRRLVPFPLTGSQRGAIKTIADDLKGDRTMRRLLQGDVGSGKTIVAVAAALFVMRHRAQAALMAPTEVLAEQHFVTIRGLLEPLGYRVALLTAGLSTPDRRDTLAAIGSGYAQFVVGTHSLIQDGARFDNLGLAVVDEQHRFGVAQRRKLLADNGDADLLVMTATPIPRSLTLALHGDLELSELRDMPPGRQPIRTLLRSLADRREVERLVLDAVRAGRQAYYVCPFIEDSDVLPGGSVEVRFGELANGPFRGLRLGLVHGQLRSADRQRAMRSFARGEIDVLVATTVIEVGVDVPNATVMVIEGAERFGLAQLHQLRGRVGRGTEPSTAALLVTSEKLSEAAERRLRVMEATNDGFRIAEEDLAIRGPGDFMGTRQSGVPPFRVADLVRDAELLREAREESRNFLASDAAASPEGARILGHVRSTWGDRFGLTAAG